VVRRAREHGRLYRRRSKENGRKQRRRMEKREKGDLLKRYV